MTIRSPGSLTGTFDPKIVESLIELEKMPIESAKKRKEAFVIEKSEYTKLTDFVTALDKSVTYMKRKPDFYQMKVESSHPDIIEGLIDGIAIPGNYEFEVRGLARNEKELAYGFPDKDESTVGFGFMAIEKANGEEVDVIIEPDSTLEKVVTQINEMPIGVKAMVINTGYYPDPYRLLVISEESGKQARITIDEDTTFLEFKEQVKGRNLDILFEDVPVTDPDNSLDELVSGVNFKVKRAEPGTRIQVGIVFDVEKTMESIGGFVENYNNLAKYINDQYIIDPETQKAGVLSGDSGIKSIMRKLQGAFATPITNGGKYNTLAQIGITTDPKTGQLKMDESKVQKALADDYPSVAKLFIQTESGLGIAARMAEKVKQISDPGYGVLKTKMRALERVIREQDEDIANKQRTMEQREESIRRRFTSLEGQLIGLKTQGDFLKARFGGQSKG